MASKRAGAVCILALCFLTIACKKLGPPVPKGQLSWKTAEYADAIPSEYGALIAVTANSQNPSWVYLWFQKTDGTIAAVFVDVSDGRVAPRALSIPRK
jgi:hypothetical protein